MSLKEQMAADADVFLNLMEFGEEVTWTPAGADPLVDPVPIAFHQGSMMVGGNLVAIESEGTLLVAKAAIPDPSLGASFVRADGKVWTIDRSGGRGSDNIFWKLAAHLNPIPTFKGR